MSVEKIIYGNFCVDRHPDGSLWEVGRGTMGVTYRAHDINLYCPVALKVVGADCVANAVAHERFVQQARAAARLRHRNVASVFFLGTDGGRVFCAMELLDGESLEAVVRRSGPLRPGMAVRVGIQVAAALAAAARQGLVHRDLKPANIMLLGAEDEDGPVVKVVDFGLTRSDVEGAGGTGFSGTPLFASPEQLAGCAPDIRSDLYSLGCTLWFLLDGMPPFMGSVAHTAAQHQHSEPPWNELPGLPPRLYRLIERLLAKDPALRPASPLEVRRELELCLASIERREALAARVALLSRRPRNWLHRQPRARIAAGLGALSLLALGALAVLRPLPENAPTVAALTPPPALLDAPEPVVVLRIAETQPPAPIRVATVPDEWFLVSEREWPDLGTPDAPFWSADFQRRLLLAREAAADPPIVPPEVLADTSAPHLATPTATQTAFPLWTVGSPDPFAMANPRFGRGPRPFAARLALFDGSSDPLSHELRHRIADRPEKARRKGSRRYAKRPPRFDPIASLLKVHRSIDKMIARIF